MRIPVALPPPPPIPLLDDAAAEPVNMLIVEEADERAELLELVLADALGVIDSAAVRLRDKSALREAEVDVEMVSDADTEAVNVPDLLPDRLEHAVEVDDAQVVTIGDAVGLDNGVAVAVLNPVSEAESDAASDVEPDSVALVDALLLTENDASLAVGVVHELTEPVALASTVARADAVGATGVREASSDVCALIVPLKDAVTDHSAVAVPPLPTPVLELCDAEGVNDTDPLVLPVTLRLTTVDKVAVNDADEQTLAKADSDANDDALVVTLSELVTDEQVETVGEPDLDALAVTEPLVA